MLTLSSVDLIRGGRRLFSPVSLRLESGEAVVVAGPNGAGKTSLLRAVAGLLIPASGEIAFDGFDDPDRARAEALHLHGWNDGLKTSRTAHAELTFWARWAGATDAHLAAAIDAFELHPLLHAEVRRLSAGQRRRLALARLLLPPRPLWLLDEPLAPLDAAMRVRFGEVMQRHLDGGGSVLAAAHDPLPVPHRTVHLHVTQESA
ncbi:heme ABC exporter ATP-binding protein CcmA [soil metagenome]